LAAGWNMLIADRYRSGAWDYDGPVPFEEMGHGVVSSIDTLMGSPFSLPASLVEWLRSGRAPADYGSLYAERRFSRFAVRFGYDERMFLEDGWSAPATEGDTSFRWMANESAGLVVPLHRAGPYVLGARVRSRGSEATAVRVLVNERPIGIWDVRAEWADQELSVPLELLRPGRNFVRLRRVGDPPSDESRVAVAGVWLQPQLQ
jgi:hypothetical protein